MKTLKIMLIAAISFFSLMSCEEELPQPVTSGTIQTIEAPSISSEDEELRNKVGEFPFDNGSSYNAKGHDGESYDSKNDSLN